MAKLSQEQKQELDQHREDLLAQLDHALDRPMIFLAFVWLALFVLEVVNGNSPLLEILGTVIWVIFLLDFALKFIIVPSKRKYLRNNVLTVLALLVPALRVFRIFRILRVLQITGSTRLVQVVGSVNRGMHALRHTMRRRGFGYVALLTIVVILASAAGILALENNKPHGIHSYPYAIYWTVMMVTTIGSEYWPTSPGGRLLTVLLSLYAVAILGYIAATLSTFFIGRDAAAKDAPIAGEDSIQELKAEVESLRSEIQKLTSGTDRRKG